MTDVVDAQTRSRMMAGIRGANTRPEMVIRRGLHRAGFRYRLHVRKIPGRPDIVLPKYEAIVLVNGCFWHGHNCPLYRIPSTRREFWKEKVRQNRLRDRRNLHIYRESGWRVAIVWECALKGPDQIGDDVVIERLHRWLLSKRREQEIKGRALPGAHGRQPAKRAMKNA